MGNEGIFHIDNQSDTLVVTPRVNLGELKYGLIERGGQSVLDAFESTDAKNLVVDFGQTDYCGSSALGFFLRLWNRARARDGHMALCNVSSHGLEILRMMRLDTLWSICDTMEDALKAVRQPGH